jgi:hypothetical protein
VFFPHLGIEQASLARERERELLSTSAMPIFRQERPEATPIL